MTEDETAPVPDPQECDSGTPHALGGETLLVVDDLPEQARMAKLILERAGFIVLTAHSGGEAMLTLDSLEGAVDLLITDLRMPGMKGPDLARDAQQRYPAVKTLFISGGSLDVDLPPGSLLLAKPYAPGELVDSVRHVLDSKS
jgi:two-component system cell cycle sensor histidine kinase/response regulator CckA